MGMETKKTTKEGVVITGASSGFGEEFADLFAKAGYQVCLVARRRALLDKIAERLRTKNDAMVEVVEADLTAPGGVSSLVDTLRTRKFPIDILVNNAGFGSFGPFDSVSVEEQTRMIRLNCEALTELTWHALSQMKLKRSGRILNVASTAAFQPGPLMAVYYATKAYVLHFSEAIADELDGSGITVTVLCPGPAQTGFQQAAKMEGSNLVKGKRIMGAREVAEAGFKALLEGRRIVIPGLKNRLLANSVRLAPRGVITKLVRKMQEEKRTPN